MIQRKQTGVYSMTIKIEMEADKIVYNNEGTDIDEVVEKILEIVR